MSPQSREKIALAVFAALIVLSLGGLGWYLVAGHSWNVAASNIDDTFGNMDGYTAIVYAGTVPPEDPDADEALVPEAGVGSASPQEPEASKSPEGEQSAASAAASASEADAARAKPEALDEAARKNSALETASSAASSTASKAKKPLTVEEARASYEGKGATVFELDTESPERYAEGTILKKGAHRFGVFSVDRPLSKRALEKQVAYFVEHKVDFIVAVTNDKAHLEGVSGVDIVVSTQDEGLFVMGETLSGTFYVDAPEIGKVGAILISPSNVVSAKVIEDL